MSEPKKERRKSRRVDIPALGATLAGPGGDSVEAQALNLSAGGVYVITPRYLTPFSKVELNLVLPPFGQEPVGKGEGARKAATKKSRSAAASPGTLGAPAGPEGAGPQGAGGEAPIRAEGIVVRCEPAQEAPGSYSLAIAFLHLTPAERNQIEAYVNWRLERSLIESAEFK